jgi:hypothetical protein
MSGIVAFTAEPADHREADSHVRQEAQRLRGVNLFLRQPSRVPERLPNIFRLEVRIAFQYFLDGRAVSDLSDDHGDRNSQPADAGTSPHDLRIESDSLEIHGLKFSRLSGMPPRHDMVSSVCSSPYPTSPLPARAAARPLRAPASQSVGAGGHCATSAENFLNPGHNRLLRGDFSRREPGEDEGTTPGAIQAANGVKGCRGSTPLVEELDRVVTELEHVAGAR